MIPARVFYFVRHGRTDANAQGLTCGGDWDIPLNAEGVEQAKLASLSFNSLNPPIDCLFVSPMLRARQTAELLNSSLKVSVEVNEDLREWRVGEWEGKPWGDVPNPFNTTEEPPGGETRESFERRLERAVNSILTSSKGVPLLVSHGAAAHALFTVLGVDKLQIENCVLYRIEPMGIRWSATKVI